MILQNKKQYICLRHVSVVIVYAALVLTLPCVSLNVRAHHAKNISNYIIWCTLCDVCGNMYALVLCMIDSS
jgi:uncharacterized membrane protein YhaH (DUF805 family)